MPSSRLQKCHLRTSAIQSKRSTGGWAGRTIHGALQVCRKLRLWSDERQNDLWQTCCRHHRWLAFQMPTTRRQSYAGKKKKRWFKSRKQSTIRSKYSKHSAATCTLRTKGSFRWPSASTTKSKPKSKQLQQRYRQPQKHQKQCTRCGKGKHP